MKSAFFQPLVGAALASFLLLALGASVRADVPEAADRAFLAASKYAAMGFYMSPAREGHGFNGGSIDFEVPVARGIDYTFIVAGDKYCQELNVYVEAEETQNTIVKDIRRKNGGLAGVRWRSDYNGVVTIVVSFVQATSRCGWCALVGRRSTASAVIEPGSPATTPPGNSQAAPAGAGTKNDLNTIREGK